jgi:dTMP kinase
MTPAVLWMAGLGLCAGAVYVLGFTILQTNVDDALRGRTFATLYALIRVCLLLAFTVAPLLSRLLGSLALSLGSHQSGVRLALWMVGVIITGAGFLALYSFRSAPAESPATT